MERGALTLLLSPKTRLGPSLPFLCYAILLSVAGMHVRACVWEMGAGFGERGVGDCCQRQELGRRFKKRQTVTYFGECLQACRYVRVQQKVCLFVSVRDSDESRQHTATGQLEDRHLYPSYPFTTNIPRLQTLSRMERIHLGVRLSCSWTGIINSSVCKTFYRETQNGTTCDWS